MSAASMAATSKPMSPAGRKVESQVGIAVRVVTPSVPGGSAWSAAMPQRPGIRNRQTKKNAVPV
jgi:hypothetical protein